MNLKFWKTKEKKPIHEQYPEILEWFIGDTLSISHGRSTRTCIYKGFDTEGIFVEFSEYSIHKFYEPITNISLGRRNALDQIAKAQEYMRSIGLFV